MKKSTIVLLKKAKNILNFSKTSTVSEITIDITNENPNNVWAFCAGQYSNDFRGNPKYLFMYINKYRKDIQAYWICDDLNLVNQIRKLGYRAYQIGSTEAELAAAKTGILVCEQVKMDIPIGLEHCKYLNLWHGVGGVKDVERSINSGLLLEEIAKKYINKNSYYRENEIYLAPSKLIEDIATKQLGLTEKQIIRAGYPRCLYQNNYERVVTFNTSEIYNKLPNDIKIVAYTPTYRNNQKEDLFINAIPDIEKLIEVCRKKHILFIFKMHPLLEKEATFINAKEKYKNCKWLCFWDNKNDFYEILDKVDLCIYDFSSIFTDFVAVGTKNFIRYNFDFEPEDLDYPMGYDEVTIGPKCKTFNELLKMLSEYNFPDLSKEIDHVKKLFWEYSTSDSMDKIIAEAINFKPKKLNLRTLYSYDIFDTLIARKVVDPIGIFYYVKDKMDTKKYSYPEYLIANFPEIRHDAEANVREYYNRTIIERGDVRCEISLEEIYDRIKVMYNLSEDASNALKELEIEAELENVLPITENIEKLKQHAKNGDEVVLISDMYLNEDIIKKMLAKADPDLVNYDLFLSSTLGYQKSRKTLYLEVYKKYGVEYNFQKWIHTGDNEHSDQKMARSLNIETVRCYKLNFNDYELDLIKKIGTYDAYLIAGSMARFRQSHPTIKAQFVYSYVSLLFVPYVYWAIHDSLSNNYENIYFISRDGHNLKKIADKINELEHLNLNMKYIYASRKTWRVPSFIDHIDVDFWGSGHGNFSEVSTFKNLLKALTMTEKDFNEIFPQLKYLKKQNKISPKERWTLVKIFEESIDYKNYLLKKAAELRKSSCGYLKQEMDINKSFSIIEYWGRGYTQENFTRLWHLITEKNDPVVFYYSRSTLPTEGPNVRKNYIVNKSEQKFIEAIFNCINYKSIEKYKFINGKWVPEIKEKDCDLELFKALEEYLVDFTKEFVQIDFINRDAIGRSLINFAINYYNDKPSWEGFVKILGEMQDSVQIYGDIKDYAPRLTNDDIEKLSSGKLKIENITKNVTISFKRTCNEVKKKLLAMYQTIDSDKIILNKMLNDKDLKATKDLNKKFKETVKNSINLNHHYELITKKTKVKNKIIVITSKARFGNIDYKCLFDALKKQKKFEVQKIALGKNKISNKDFAKTLAEAKYIILKGPMALFHEVHFRKDNKTIILSENVLYYFNKGLAVSTNNKTKDALTKYEFEMDTNIIPVASEKIINKYSNMYNVNDETKMLVTGNVLTDCYFDKEQKTDLRKSLNIAFPEAKDKKVICYIPYERYKAKTKHLNFLNLKQLEQNFKGEYVVIINRQKKNTDYSNVLNIKGFSKDLTETFNIREQMMMADIIVGDYRDTAFESPLLNVPVFMSVWDKATINAKTNLQYDFNDLKYGVEINSTADLIEKIKDIAHHDYKIQNTFKKKYLTECKGKSAKNLVKYLIESENEK